MRKKIRKTGNPIRYPLNAIRYTRAAIILSLFLMMAGNASSSFYDDYQSLNYVEPPSFQNVEWDQNTYIRYAGPAANSEIDPGNVHLGNGLIYLLHLNGDIMPAVGISAQAQGNAVPDNADSRLGGGSCNFDGAAASLIDLNGSNPGIMGNLSTFTVSLWAKSNTIRPNSGYLFRAWVWPSTEICYLMNSPNTALLGKVCTGGGEAYASGNPAFNDTEWHHIAMVFDGDPHVYVDGVLNTGGRNNISGVTANGTNGGLQIGSGFNGLIDEFAIWSRALNASEIQQLAGQIPPSSFTSKSISLGGTFNTLHGTWDPDNSNISVFISSDETTWNPIARGGDISLSNISQIYYKVNFAGQVSLDNIALDWRNAPAPLAPANLGVSNITCHSITLNWDAVADATNYKIYRSLDGQDFTLITQTSLSQSQTTYTDNTVAADTIYYYQVIALNGVGASPPAAVSGKTLVYAGPTISVTAPGNGATVSGVVLLKSDPYSDIGVREVVFYIDADQKDNERLVGGTIFNRDADLGHPTPYQNNWDTRLMPNGSHTVVSIVCDNNGNTKESEKITVNVDNPVTQPYMPMFLPEPTPWAPPFGIPDPGFGIRETHMMYAGQRFDFNGNGILEAGEEYRDAGNGPYTYYVDNTDLNATETNNPYGTQAVPRKTIPENLPAGAVVEVHGGPYYYDTSGPIAVTANGAPANPVFIRGVGTPGAVTEIVGPA